MDENQQDSVRVAFLLADRGVREAWLAHYGLGATCLSGLLMNMGREPTPGKAVPEENTPRLPMAHTTAEVICVLGPSPAGPVDHAFEQAIDQLAQFQTYCHLSTKTPVHRLTRKLLPPLLPLVRPSFSSPDEWEDGLFHVNNGGTMFLAASTPIMAAEQLRQMLDHKASRAEIFEAFMLMRQEALLLCSRQ